MTHARTLAVALQGLAGTLVEVEADVSQGLPCFTVVGLPDSSTLQARDRVRAAAGSCGVPLAQRRITVNLQPAWQQKRGSGFDLAIAVAVLAAQKAISPTGPAQVVHLGELGLDGQVRPIPGVLPALCAARDAGATRALVALDNLAEARLVPGIDVEAVRHLAEVIQRWGGDLPRAIDMGPLLVDGDAPPVLELESAPASGMRGDFSDVIGQQQARTAAEVAAAGGHHLLLTGPPGTGKSMIASRIPTILPPLDDDDALVVSQIQSLSGKFQPAHGLTRTAPFENPHHTASASAIVGGGTGMATPGAISRAHGGVLFLDEAPEFSPRVLEALREPLENGVVTLHRSRGAVTYPARFQLVLASNPCPCGEAWGTRERCTCTPQQRRRYRGKLSGPIMDRIDIRVGVGAIKVHHAALGTESSHDIASRVAKARQRQRERFTAHTWNTNAQIPPAALRSEFAPPTADVRVLDRAVSAGKLTLRGRDRVLRLAWTVADLAGDIQPDSSHIGQALALRGDAA